MTKFKVGDRVKVRRNAKLSAGDCLCGVVHGRTGVVEGFGFKAQYEIESDVIYVRFDHEIRLGTDLNADGTYQVWREQIELIDASSAAIDQYTAACQAFEAAQLALEKAKAAVEDARNDLRDALDGEA